MVKFAFPRGPRRAALGRRTLAHGLAAVALAAGVSVAASPNAWAFCRATTCVADCQLDANRCVAEGEPLHYESTCLTYAVERGAGEAFGMTDAAFEAIVVAAFDQWLSADCGAGTHPGLVLQSVGVVETNGPHVCWELPESNLGVWSVAQTWTHPGDNPGHTSPSFSDTDGVLLDADVELNGAYIREEVAADLLPEAILGVAAHEAGHFLGLAHSSDPESLMAVAYLSSAPELAQDDIDGICALYPPKEAEAQCAAAAVSDAALSAEACASAAEEARSLEMAASECSGTWDGETCTEDAANNSGCSVSVPAKEHHSGSLWGSSSLCFWCGVGTGAPTAASTNASRCQTRSSSSCGFTSRLLTAAACSISRRTNVFTHGACSQQPIAEKRTGRRWLRIIAWLSCVFPWQGIPASSDASLYRVRSKGDLPFSSRRRRCGRLHPPSSHFAGSTP